MASMKSSCLMADASRRSASIPASTQIAFTWAPLKSSQQRLSSSKFTSSLSTFIFLEWICMIRARASSFGCGSSIFRSRRPDRSRAGSSTSGRFVAAMTLMLSFEEKPSSWLSSSSMVRCTSRSPDCSPPKRLVPIASSSSMKMMAPLGLELGSSPSFTVIFSFANSKASRTSLAPSPINICTSCGPASLRNTASVCFAHARARSVLPVPGGPCNKTPLGGRIPMASNISLWVMGRTTASISSWICLSQPPMSE
mmetsp:Transcript_61363/g.138916  ORF Transcript_61363/g.138916 Transcript_61363/m.138916 type:complete len:254 (-) Transcript_61363:589-1350(-)